MANGLKYLGPALTEIGSSLGAYGSQQDELRRNMVAMVQARQDKLAEENRQNALLKIQQADEARKATSEKDLTDIGTAISTGHPGEPLPAPVAPDSTWNGSTPTPTEMISSQRGPRTNLTRDEIIQKFLEKGIDPPKAWLEYTKPKEYSIPDDLQGYRLAVQQGFTGGILDYKKAVAQSTHIDVGGAAETRAKQQEVNALRTGNASQTKDYDIGKRAALAFDQDYKRYEAIKKSGNQQAIKVAQQGMLDKYITSSTGKSTGDAQFNNFRDSQGLTNSIQNLYAKVMEGSMAPDEAFQEMRKITMGTAEALRGKTKQANSATADMAAASLPRLGYINPQETYAHPDKMLAQDSTSFAIPDQAAIDTAGASKIKTKSGKSYLIKVH